MHTLRIEKKLSLSVLSIGSLSRSKEGSGDWQEMPMKRFQLKPHSKNLENTIKNPMTPYF